MRHTSDHNGTSVPTTKKGRTCYMAYTLNNVQPVVCTLVSDQPYFYMDEENTFDDLEDAILDHELNELEHDLADLRQKMEAYERLSQSFQHEPERRLDLFAAEAGAITQQNSGQSAGIDHLADTLRQSRMGAALLDFAYAHNVDLVASAQTGTVRYDRSLSKIQINPHLGAVEQVLLTARELRRHFQHRKGAMVHPLTFHPDHAVLINRAQQADLSIAMVRIAWELQLAGHKDAWSYVENSGMSDLGRAFAREAFADFRSLSSGKASSAVFESWFLSERCRHQDKKLIQAMLADHQGYVFTSEEISRTVSIELITALGEQPFGKNYLAPYAQMILSDVIFTEVRDRSNANFLWFIKFERSFRETEQALQSGGDFNESGVLPPRTYSEPTFAKESDYDPEGIVIPWPGQVIHKRESLLRGRNLEESAAAANVIHVRFGNGDAS